jgi:iron(III) transport system ATP-binding protein
MSTITCRRLSKAFGDVEVLRDLELQVPDGSVVTVLGESGSGKTTLLRLVAGFERPDRGRILIDEQVVDGPGAFVPPEKRRIGYVAQEGNLFPHLTVAKNIAFGMARRARSRARVEELLELVDLGGFGKRYPHELSGGQQQRVALARALAPRPAVVLLDEPFSSLDAGLRASLRVDVMRILRERRATAVLVTHDQSEALSVADLVGVMDAGRIRQFATPEALYTTPADAEVARFLGEANLVTGTASGGAVRTLFGELPLAEPSRGAQGPVVVLVRPERIVLRRADPASQSAGTATGTVVHREYYGHDSMVLLDVHGASGGESQPVRVRCSGKPNVEIGDLAQVTAVGDVVAWPDDRRR